MSGLGLGRCWGQYRWTLRLISSASRRAISADERGDLDTLGSGEAVARLLGLSDEGVEKGLLLVIGVGGVFGVPLCGDSPA
jgi:hypothetical protein